MNLHRTIVLLVTVIASLFLGGGQCYATTGPITVCYPSHFSVLYWMDIRPEKPALFHAKMADPSRRAVEAVVIPKDPVPCGYHPQPAHC